MTTLTQVLTTQANKEVTLNNLMTAVSAAGTFGRKLETTNALTFGYYGGVVVTGTNTLSTIADGTLTMTDATINYIEVNAAGTVSTNTSGFTAGRRPLYTVTTSGGAMTAVTDWRTSEYMENPYIAGNLTVNGNLAVTGTSAFTGAITSASDITLATTKSLTWTGGVNYLTCTTASGAVDLVAATTMRLGAAGFVATLTSGTFAVTGTVTATGQILSTKTGNADASGIYQNAAGQSTIAIRDSTQAANAKLWDMSVGIVANALIFRAINDAISVASTWLSVLRSGTTITSVIFPSSPIGVGISAISSWDAGFPSIVELINGAVVSNVNSLRITSNAYYNAGFKYMATAPAGLLEFDQGPFSFYTAASGTAGNAVTFNEQVRITHTASSSRYLTFTGSNGGNPTISTSAGSINIPVSIALSGGGTVITANTAGTGPQIVFDANNNSGSGGRFIMGIADSSGGTSILSGGTAYAVQIAEIIGRPMEFGIAGALKMALTAAGYLKASNSGTFVSATGAYHEMYQDNNANQFIAIFKHAAATASNQSGIEVIEAGDPNSTGSEFLYCVGNATLRASIRSNGGLANFSANNVNLSDRRVKNWFEAFVVRQDLGGGAANDAQWSPAFQALWNAHKEMRGVWGAFTYADQTGDHKNYGYLAQGVARAFEHAAPDLVVAWGLDGLLGVRQENLHNITGAIVTELQYRSDEDRGEIAGLKKRITELESQLLRKAA